MFTALFYYLFILFVFLPQCEALFLGVDSPAPAQGSDLFPGQGFTLLWSGSSDRFSTMDIELWYSHNKELRKQWVSIDISSKSLSDTIPDIPSGNYYFWLGATEGNEQFGDSGDFLVTVAPTTGNMATDGISNSQTNLSVTSAPNPSSSAGSLPAAMVRSNQTPTSAIVGGTLGGVVILVIIAAFIIIRRRSNLQELRTYGPTVSGVNIPRVMRQERTLQKALPTAPEERQTVIPDLEWNMAENRRRDSVPSNADEEMRRLTNQVVTMTTRIQQLATQERVRQNTVVGLNFPPPIYRSGHQAPVNQGAAAVII